MLRAKLLWKKACFIKITNNNLGTQWSLEVALSNLKKPRYTGENAKLGRIIFYGDQIKQYARNCHWKSVFVWSELVGLEK